MARVCQHRDGMANGGPAAENDISFSHAKPCWNVRDDERSEMRLSSSDLRQPCARRRYPRFGGYALRTGALRPADRRPAVYPAAAFPLATPLLKMA